MFLRYYLPCRFYVLRMRRISICQRKIISQNIQMLILFFLPKMRMRWWIFQKMNISLKLCSLALVHLPLHMVFHQVHLVRLSLWWAGWRYRCFINSSMETIIADRHLIVARSNVTTTVASYLIAGAITAGVYGFKSSEFCARDFCKKMIVTYGLAQLIQIYIAYFS